ncbi:lytic transglycosylase domain-containing protein [Bradyrhizobium viridifuturi]|nr:lytic transglycosylase domain-containing protein [Bradyrhizobium viridifuturi]MBR1075124.1 lytic transglycosylase domain-containing protein [Bradyrhizobium viridifuturi]
MSRRAIAMGFGLLAVVSSAQAQDTRLAAVDGSGRILPVASPAAVVQTIGTVRGATPCPKAKAMTPEDARALIGRIAAEERFSPDFTLSVAKNESHFDAIALSDKGAFGLMQLMPDTARRFKVDLCDPADNVRGGVRYLQALTTRYRNPLYIVAAYNAGEDAVDKNRGVPPYPETVRFVAQVINDFYTWPTPNAPASHPPRERSAVAADLIEPSQADSVTERKPATQSRDPAQWSDGFVMHVD